MKLIFKSLVFSLILVGCSIISVKASDDTSIRRDLSSLMAMHPEFCAAIAYEVNQGVVVLQGEVTNFADKAFAERIAANIPGVYRVRNLLVIDYNKKNF